MASERSGRRARSDPETPREIRNRLRRRVEHERLALTDLERLLGVEGDPDALTREVARLLDERAALRERVAELEAGPTPGRAALEAVVLYLGADGIRHVSPLDGDTVRAARDPDLDPHETIVDAVAELGLTPLMVHSTSWRIVEQQLVLTFLVAIEPPAAIPPGLAAELVTRVDLARGRATGPPPEVHLPQVVEHGLRHLAWLVREDEAIHEALGVWTAALRGYEPEPFRAFGRRPRP